MTPQQVLTAHQWDDGDEEDEPWRCTCGQEQPRPFTDDTAADVWMANHQLLELAGAGLAIVPTRGTERIVREAVAWASMPTDVLPHWRQSRERALRDAVEALGQ